MKSIQLFGATLLASTTLLGAASAFAEVSQPTEANPNTAQTSIGTELTVNQTPDKPQPPKKPDGGTDQPTEIEGLFGIAYAPGALSGQKQLSETGTTTVDLSNNTGSNSSNKHNVGVQDKTRAKDRNWSLKAQLEWTGDDQGYMDGATITATEGKVQLNDGKGNLSAVPEDAVTIGDNAATLTISKDSQVEIMKANTGKTVNGVYNYQFKDPKLVVPNSENVATGSYTWNIVWNLSNVLEGDGNPEEPTIPSEQQKYSFVVNNYKSPAIFDSWEETEETRHNYVMSHFKSRSNAPTCMVTTSNHETLDIPQEYYNYKYKLTIKNNSRPGGIHQILAIVIFYPLHHLSLINKQQIIWRKISKEGPIIFLDLETIQKPMDILLVYPQLV
ncbi:MAG: WxL domain-containing protein [Clostridiales bacterium]|nr:WxL domain-containing protein [Clostridiales bacterium]